MYKRDQNREPIRVSQTQDTIKRTINRLLRIAGSDDPVIMRDKAKAPRDKFSRELPPEEDEDDDDDGTTLQRAKPMPFAGGIRAAARSNMFNHLVKGGSYSAVFHKNQQSTMGGSTTMAVVSEQEMLERLGDELGSLGSSSVSDSSDDNDFDLNL